MNKAGELRGRWEKADANRRELLEEARICAALSKPWVLPPEDQQPNEELPENYQSLGSRGVTNLEGKMLLALYPPGVPWFNFSLSPKIRYDPKVSPEAIHAIEQALFTQELAVMAMLESADITDDGHRRPSAFRSRKRTALSQLLVTGDVLEQITDDYRWKVYGRQQYVTKRNSEGDVLFHGIRESVDPLSLTEDQQRKSGLNLGDLAKKNPDERMEDLFTFVEWQPQKRGWLIRQEVNGHIVNESEETVSPYFSTPFELAPNEDYGRGFVELNRGDLRSLNELELRLLDFAALASRNLIGLDPGSTTRPRDLSKPSGEIIRTRIINGQWADVGILRSEKSQDFGVVFQSAERKRKDLGSAMLLESEITPRGERVTAYQVQRVAMELEGALGGAYAPIADLQQVPVIRRVVHMMQRDKLMPVLPKEAVSISLITGIAALRREIDAGKMFNAIQAIQALGPEAIAKINLDVVVELVMRYLGVDSPGILKSPEQIAAEQQQAIAAQTALAAGEKAVDVAGNVAQNALTGEQNA